MERRNLALLCAGVLCFWLFALAFGTAEGRGGAGALGTARSVAVHAAADKLAQHALGREQGGAIASLGICFFCEERTVGANFSGKSTLFFEDLENFTIFVPLTGD